MTGTNDKLRGLLLAVLMVTSVFAGTIALSGTAAAATNASFTSLSNAPENNGNAEVDEGSTLDHTLVFSVDDISTDGNTDTIELNFPAGQISDVSVSSSNIDGGVSGSANVVNDGQTISFDVSPESGDGDGTFTVDFTAEWPNVPADTQGDLTIDVSDSGNDDISGETLASLLIVNSGGTDELEASDDYDEELQSVGSDNNARFWQGQTLYIDSNNFDGETLELYSLTRDDDQNYIQDNFQGQVSIDNSGEATLGTSNLEGNYALYTSGGDPVEFVDADGTALTGAGNANDARFSVTPQTLDVEFDDSSVEDDESTELLIDSNRASYDVNVSADGLDDDELADIFEDETDAVPDDDDVFQFTVTSNDAEISANFDGIDADEYDFDVNVTDTGVTASDSITVSESDEATASFAQSAYSEAAGDVVEITVDLQDTSTGTVFIGNPESNYLAEVDIEDDDDDQVVLQFNTFAPTQSASFTADDDDDTVELIEVYEGGFDRDVITGDSDFGVLDAADYDVNVTTGGFDSDDIGSEEDVATLSLTETTVTGFSILHAPGGDFGDLDDAEAVAEARLDGSVTSTNEVATGDVIVHELQGNGIYGAIDATSNIDGINNDAQVIDALNDFGEDGDGNPSVELRFKQDDAVNTDLNYSFSELLDEDFSADDVDVVTDDQNGSLYVHVDSAAMLDSDNFPDGNSFEEGDTVNVTLKFYEESDLVDENTKIFATFDIVEPDAEFDSNAEDADGDDIVEVEAAADQRITGTTNLAPGTEVNVRARATGDSPFLFSNETTVTPNGTFNVTFDFSNVSSEQEFDLEISSPSEINDVSIDGVVAAAPSANVTISNQSGNGQTVMVDSVTMSEGGFVTIHDSTLVSDGDAIGSVRGTSEYLANGTTENVTVTLDTPLNESGTVIAMPHLDTNGNEVYDFVTSEGADDSPYTTAAGDIVTDSANYTVEDGEIATVSIEAQEGDGSSVTVASAFLPNGGFVTIHDGTVSDDPLGSVRGTSEYLEPGTTEDITVALDDPFTESQVAIAMPHRDTNGNQAYDFVSSEGEEDAPYLNADDQIVIDSADYTIPTPTPTPTEAPTDSPTPTETAAPTDSPTPMDTTEPPTTTSTGQPGFTVIVALMAFLAAALLAIRRD